MLGVAGLIAAFMLLDLHLPRVEDAPAPPPPVSPRAFRSLTTGPELAPSETYEGPRDPFKVQDPWQASEPALLALPPVAPWPRALPGGLRATPRDPSDRLLVQRPEGTE